MEVAVPCVAIPGLLCMLLFWSRWHLAGYVAFPPIAWAKSYHHIDILFFCYSVQIFFGLLLFLTYFLAQFKRRTNVKTREFFFFFQKVKLPISKSLLINFLFWLPPQSWSSHPLDLLGRADEITAPCGHKSPPYTSCKWGNWHIWNPVSFFNPGVAQIQHQGKTSTLKLDSSNS